MTDYPTIKDQPEVRHVLAHLLEAIRMLVMVVTDRGGDSTLRNNPGVRFGKKK
jgi:hypothetical protein